MLEAGDRKPDILDQIRGVTPDVVAAARLLLVSAGAEIPPQDGMAGILESGQAPAVIIRQTPEDEEWRRQTDRFIAEGFHEALQIADPEAYRLSIPHFPQRPRSYEDEVVYDKLLVVEPRIALPQLHRLLGITDYIDPAAVTNTIRIPRKPYTICLQSGPVELFVGTFNQAIARVPRNGVAVALIETDMAYLRYLELFQPWIDTGSSRHGADYVPCLGVGGGMPRVGTHWVGDPYGTWRLLSRGKILGT